MKTFKDMNGREWNVAIDLNAARRVRDITKFHLLNPDVGGTVKALGSDIVLLVDVLYSICKPQADAQKISDEEFGRSVDGAQLESALEAIRDGVVDFFPQSREANTKIFAALKDVQQKLKTQLDQKLDSGEFASSLESELKKYAGNSPGSSE